MKGRALGFGFLMGGLGVLGGWCLWGGPGVGELKYVREWVVENESGGMAAFFEEWAGAEELEGALLGFCVLDESGELV